MIRGEVASARQQVEAERARHRALREQVRPKAEQAVQAALGSYAAGTTSGVTVIDAVRAAWELRADEVMAEVRLGLAWARLGRALGELSASPASAQTERSSRRIGAGP
jgi:outer membrane protein TolC